MNMTTLEKKVGLATKQVTMMLRLFPQGRMSPINSKLWISQAWLAWGSPQWPWHSRPSTLVYVLSMSFEKLSKDAHKIARMHTKAPVHSRLSGILEP